ncbi:MAG: adenylate/guanylate cyclase domain-containing protein [Pseudomonadota bacterium]
MARFWGLVLLAALLSLRVSDPPVVEMLRAQSFDFYQRVKPREFTPLPVTIVDIDERSLETLGQWPWPRTRMAELVDRLRQMQVPAVAFDILFAEEDRLSPALVAQDNPNLSTELKQALAQLPSNDSVFAQKISQFRVILGQSSVRSVADNRDEKREMRDAPHAFLGPDPKPLMFNLPDIIQNRPEFEAVATGRGVFTVVPDVDGVFRRIPIVMMVQDKVRLGLAPELLRIATGGRATAIRSDAAGITRVDLARGVQIATDNTGRVWPYFTHSKRERFVSVADIMERKVPPQRLAGHLVLVGTSAVGLEDYRATPMNTLMAGVEIHAQVLENILSKSMLVRPNYAIALELGVILALGLFVVMLVPHLGALWSIIYALVLLTGYLFASWYAFSNHRLLLDPVFPVASTMVLFVVMATTNYLREERQRRETRAAFGQYVSPALVDQLADDPAKLELGGETRDLSVLFSDVRGFTAISESFKDNPQGLTELMNRFLTTMSNAILDKGGTIDKFMGDAVMAFWNAPLEVEDHELASCRSALAMIERVDALNDAVAEEAKATLAENPDRKLTIHRIDIGIGINSGACVVGNMGSENRFDYTALGDTVNVASRLEGQSKPYGVKIVLGSSTAKAVENEMATLEIDQIRVKGKDEPERIFGLFGDKEKLEQTDFIAARALNRTMLSAYRTQDWSSAFEALEMLRELDDRVKLGLSDYLFIYETRIAEFRANPPGRHWDGVYTATSK